MSVAAKAFGIYRDRFLVVDGDRASKGDWSIEELKSHASEYRITVIVQKPNHEGLLLRLLPGRERRVPNASSASALLKAQWPNYEKPVNANTLRCRYSLGDLIRVATFDEDLAMLLERIGLMNTP